MLTVISDPDEIPVLHKAVLKHVCPLVSGADGAALRKKMRGITDPEVLADFAAGNFLPDYSHRHELVGMCDLNERLKYLVNILASV